MTLVETRLRDRCCMYCMHAVSGGLEAGEYVKQGLAARGDKRV